MEERILGTLLGPEGTKVLFGPTFQIIKVKDPLVWIGCRTEILAELLSAVYSVDKKLQTILVSARNLRTA